MPWASHNITVRHGHMTMPKKISGLQIKMLLRQSAKQAKKSLLIC